MRPINLHTRATKYHDIAHAKAHESVPRLLLLSFLAGFFIAITGVGTLTATAAVENASIAKLISGLLFPAGLAMILVAGGELFTGNMLMAVSLFSRRLKLWPMLRNWLLVFLGNLIGSLFVVFLANYGMQDAVLPANAIALKIMATAAFKLQYPFLSAFTLGILCNMVVCTAIWMSFSVDTAMGRIGVVYFPVMLFALTGIEHCIANMYFIPAGILFAADPVKYALAAAQGIPVELLTVNNFIFNSTLPVTLGNILGGCIIAWIYYYLNVKSHKD